MANRSPPRSPRHPRWDIAFQLGLWTSPRPRPRPTAHGSFCFLDSAFLGGQLLSQVPNYDVLFLHHGTDARTQRVQLLRLSTGARERLKGGLSEGSVRAHWMYEWRVNLRGDECSQWMGGLMGRLRVYGGVCGGWGRL